MNRKAMVFEIMYRDLTEDAQKRLKEAFNTSEDKENWDVFPIAELIREPEE